MNVSTKRMVWASTLAALVSAAVVTVGTLPASADTVSTSYHCTSGGQVSDSAFDVTITAPAAAAAGSTIDVAVSLTSKDSTPVEIPAKSANGTMKITLGGSSTGTIAATGLTNLNTIPAGSTYSLMNGAAQTVLPASGAVTFTPSSLTASFGNVVSTCDIAGTASIAATIKII